MEPPAQPLIAIRTGDPVIYQQVIIGGTTLTLVSVRYWAWTRTNILENYSTSHCILAYATGCLARLAPNDS